MDPDCTAFTLSPPWCDEKLLLVRATDAIRLCRDGGHVALSLGQTGSHLANLGRRDLGNLRQFVAVARLSRFPLSSLDDQQLLALIAQSLKVREVVGLRKADGAGANDGGAKVEQRQLIRDIERQTRGRLHHGGRRYKLVADVDLSRLPARDSYEVVRHDEAAAVLDALAKDNGTAGDLLAKAKQGLTPDWRPPLSPDGLILLRKSVTVQSTGPDLAGAVTPSQLKKLLAKTEWIEIVVSDDLGKSYTGPYRIQVPDGSVREGSFDEQGLWGDYDIDPGKCKLLLPDVPEKTKPGVLPPDEVTTWIAVKLVDDEGQPIAGKAYRLKLSAGPDRAGTTGEDEIRAEGIAPGTCIFSLESEDSTAAPGEVTVTEDSPVDAALGILDAIVEDAEGRPIANHRFEAHFPDGTVMEGETDENGRVYLENCPSEQCKLKFFEST